MGDVLWREPPAQMSFENGGESARAKYIGGSIVLVLFVLQTRCSDRFEGAMVARGIHGNTKSSRRAAWSNDDVGPKIPDTVYGRHSALLAAYISILGRSFFCRAPSCVHFYP